MLWNFLFSFTFFQVSNKALLEHYNFASIGQLSKNNNSNKNKKQNPRGSQAQCSVFTGGRWQLPQWCASKKLKPGRPTMCGTPLGFF